MDFWYRVIRAWKDKQTTLYSIASRISEKPTTVSQWMQNGTIPAANQIIVLSNELNISAGYLLFGENPINSYHICIKRLIEIASKIRPKQVNNLINIAMELTNQNTSTEHF